MQMACRACSTGRVDAARTLVETGKAKLTVKDRQGMTPLHVAADSGQQTATLYLMSRGADPEVCMLHHLQSGIIGAKLEQLAVYAHPQQCTRGV